MFKMGEGVNYALFRDRNSFEVVNRKRGWKRVVKWITPSGRLRIQESFNLRRKQLRNVIRTRDTINRRGRRWLIRLIHTVYLLPKAFGVGGGKSRAAIFSRLMNCSRRFRHLTSYLYRDLEDFLIWWRAPEEGDPACFQTACQKLVFSLYKRAAVFHPGTEEEWHTVGRVDTAQWWRHCESSSQNQSSAEECTVHWGSQQSLIELGSDRR